MLDFDKNKDGFITRELQYRSVTDNSLIKSFELLKYNAGDIRIRFTFQKEAPDFKEYLQQHDFHLDDFSWKNGSDITDFKQMNETKTLIKLLLENNAISAEEIDRINNFFDNKLYN